MSWRHIPGGPSTQNPWRPRSSGEGDPQQIPLPLLMLGGTFLGRGPSWRGRKGPAHPAAVGSLSNVSATLHRAGSAGGTGWGPRSVQPPFPRHNEPGREGRFLRGGQGIPSDLSLRARARARRVPGHRTGHGASEGMWGWGSLGQGYPLNRGLRQGGFPARLRVLLELEGMRLVLELEQNW